MRSGVKFTYIINEHTYNVTLTLSDINYTEI